MTNYQILTGIAVYVTAVFVGSIGWDLVRYLLSLYEGRGREFDEECSKW